jgi:hypothetical protein
MAHFAELDQNNIVKQVVVVDNSIILDENEVEVEELGVDFLEEVYGHRNWKQTSYNGNFRCHYAQIGGTYDEEKDIFIHKKPFPSWVLNIENNTWKPPIPKPTPKDGSLFIWNEEIGNWVDILNPE